MTKSANTNEVKSIVNEWQFKEYNFIKKLRIDVIRFIERFKTGDRIFRTGTYVILSILVFVFIFPFIYMIVTSLKTNADLYNFTVNWIPRTIKFRNYTIAFRLLEYPNYFKNSFIITVFSTVGHLLACSFIGYGFARYEFPGKSIIFFIVIVSIIVPVQTIIISQYILFSNLKWLNTYLPIIVPTFFGYGLRGGLFIFIFRQFYLGLPKELEEAAKIDGCGFFRTYWNIVVPVARPAFMVALVLSIVWHWNDFYEPSIYLKKIVKMPLPSRLNEIINLVRNPITEDFIEEALLDKDYMEGENAINNAVLMAGTFLVVLPILTAFGFLQRKFMQGIERTGLVE